MAQSDNKNEKREDLEKRVIELEKELEYRKKMERNRKLLELRKKREIKARQKGAWAIGLVGLIIMIIYLLSWVLTS